MSTTKKHSKIHTSDSGTKNSCPLSHEKLEEEKIIDETKFCTLCEDDKLIDKFYKRKAKKDGRLSICKSCYNKRRKARNKIKKSI